ncbi:MAG: hypothetical protein HY898_21830 [Deltaproteobacteria bacterium]|nr:hypothetical protein [Deltaproteobacteria bacterium]
MRLAVLCLAGLIAGPIACSSDGSTVEEPGAAGADAGEDGADGSTLRGCIAHGAPCSDSASCCSKQCDPGSLSCTSTVGRCVPADARCSAPTDCCTLSCIEGLCAADACLADGKVCTDSAQCCSADCTQGTCKTLNTSCSTAGNPCDGNDACCSKLCSNGTCSLGASFCIQAGDACAVGADCCGGICTRLPEATLGTCGSPPAGASFCNGGFDGTVCQSCGDCCSRLCVAWGNSGVKVCQRTSGCHIDGDLCRKDADCCGAPGTGLPGEGNGKCELQEGKDVGICRMPKGCNPEGNVCRNEGSACDVSTARSDCCGAPGSPDACQLDALGVPRCRTITACRKQSETCAYASDCCDAAPCVPNPNGVLRCAAQQPEAGTACSEAGGSCTVKADCCSGIDCYLPTGSTHGTCWVPGAE